MKMFELTDLYASLSSGTATGSGPTVALPRRDSGISQSKKSPEAPGGEADRNARHTAAKKDQFCSREKSGKHEHVRRKMEGKVGPHDMQAKSTCKYILWLWGRGIWMGGPKALSPLYTLLVPLPSLIICGGDPGLPWPDTVYGKRRGGGVSEKESLSLSQGPRKKKRRRRKINFSPFSSAN